jgi:succinate dehydrogenase / fumarate reductase iron-sulfur subunit
MEFIARVSRFNPEKDESPQLVDYRVRLESGMSVLGALHQIHDEQDGSLAYRYSCRGAICGTCAIHINGVARLACKTQVSELLQENKEIVLTPLSHLGVIKDLVVDKRPYWESIKKTMPWLVREVELADEKAAFDKGLDRMQLDQLQRSADCIKCACCYSDCPKVGEMPEFIGPAVSIQIYKQLFDARDTRTAERIKYASAKEGVFACDSYAACVKVCPKDCRPLRAINMIKKKIESTTV